jgi:flavin reductase (DIM6/NTAB) family NADH-FMN oxidoreductase RutF
MTSGEPAASVDLTLLRRVMGSFATGVTVILAEAGGEVRGMTANAFLSGSLEPPLCVVSVALTANMHRHLTAAGRFSVNILSSAQDDLALHFAGRLPGLERPELPRHDGIPLLPDAAAQLCAEVEAAHACGDHTLFVGRIKWIGANQRSPLVYHAGRFGTLLAREETGALLEFW